MSKTPSLPTRKPSSKIIQGDVRSILRSVPEDWFHCVVTSPPYFNLRDYDLPPLEWGVEKECKHVWDDDGYCIRDCCGAWRGCLGLEPNPELYIANLVEVFEEVKRVLRPDGICWLNLGDCYSGKELWGIPWKVAFALQEAGWFLRTDIVYAKSNPIPESVGGWCNELVLDDKGESVQCENCSDGSCGDCWEGKRIKRKRGSWRPTRSHEFIFMLMKNDKYFADRDAVMEETITREGVRKNPRSVWTHSTVPFKDCHFAVFSADLVRRPVRASVSERGCCDNCGAPFLRVIRRTKVKDRDDKELRMSLEKLRFGKAPPPWKGWEAKRELLGWAPSCNCSTVETVPCRLLDPFCGSGTMGLIAKELGLDFVGVDLSELYCDMARKRIREFDPDR